MNDEPAFPFTEYYLEHGVEMVSQRHPGMTLRDYFAAKAMQALLSSANLKTATQMKDLAPATYIIADAMLEARKQKDK